MLRCALYLLCAMVLNSNNCTSINASSPSACSNPQQHNHHHARSMRPHIRASFQAGAIKHSANNCQAFSYTAPKPPCAIENKVLGGAFVSALHIFILSRANCRSSTKFSIFTLMKVLHVHLFSCMYPRPHTYSTLLYIRDGRHTEALNFCLLGSISLLK